MRLCCRHYLSVPEISGEQAEFMPGMKYIYGGGCVRFFLLQASLEPNLEFSFNFFL